MGRVRIRQVFSEGRQMNYGRIVFGASAVLYGVLALRWHDADTWQTLSEIWRLPAGAIAGGILMSAQIAGAVGIQIPRIAHRASMLLVAVYSIFSFACVPEIFKAPAVYFHYGSFFEQFSLLCGVLALCAATGRKEPSIAVARMARLGLGVCAVSFMLSQIIYFSLTASMVPRWIPPSQTFWTILTTAAFGLAAISLLINRQTRAAIRLTVVMLAMFGLLVWVPRVIAHPESHFNWSELALTFLITGAWWMAYEAHPLK